MEENSSPTKGKTILDSPKKEGKVDLISDVIKFVAELNAVRYTGDTLLKTLTRVMAKTFIEKYEYDSAMKQIPDLATLSKVATSVDKLQINLDSFDVKLSQMEQVTNDYNIEMVALKSELERKPSMLDLEVLQEDLKKKASIGKFIELDQKIQRCAQQNDILEINAKAEVLKSEVSQMAKVSYVKSQVESLSNEVKETIADFATHESIQSAVNILEAKIKKMKRDFKTELESFASIEDEFAKIQAKLAKTVPSQEFETELDKIWSQFKTYTNFVQFKHLQNHMDEVEPILEECKERLNEYRRDNLESKQIISRFDEILLEKASKFALDELTHRLGDFCLLKDFKELKHQIKLRTEENKQHIESVKTILYDSIDDVKTDIKDTFVSMEKQMKGRIQDFLNKYTIKPEEIQTLLNSKANFSDILEIQNK